MKRFRGAVMSSAAAPAVQAAAAAQARRARTPVDRDAVRRDAMTCLQKAKPQDPDSGELRVHRVFIAL
jgi:hypothetical protein